MKAYWKKMMINNCQKLKKKRSNNHNLNNSKIKQFMIDDYNYLYIYLKIVIKNL